MDQDDHIVRANPVPDLNKKFEVKIQRSIVRTEPFSFEQRDQHKRARKEQLIREEEIKVMFNDINPGIITPRYIHGEDEAIYYDVLKLKTKTSYLNCIYGHYSQRFNRDKSHAMCCDKQFNVTNILIWNISPIHYPIFIRFSVL